MSDVLRIEDLDTAGQWLHFDVGPHLERSYRQATGWSGAEALGAGRRRRATRLHEESHHATRWRAARDRPLTTLGPAPQTVVTSSESTPTSAVSKHGADACMSSPACVSETVPPSPRSASSWTGRS